MDIAIALLQHYSFDLGGYTITDLTFAWKIFKPEWVRQAVIESLFQGRYKAVSVNQILQLWKRKGEPNCRYNREFERLVCGDVAVIYEDRIYYTPPRTSNRAASVTEIPPFTTAKESTSPLPFPRRSMLDSGKISQVNQLSAIYKPQRYPSRLNILSGTTPPRKVYPANVKSEYSEAYLSAYDNMTLLAESSLFVDKLRSMCGDRVVFSDSAIASNINKVEVAIKD